MISARTRIIKNSLHVRKWHSVPERASCGTEYARGAKTGSCGTRRIFRGTRCADNYLLLIQEPEHPERDLIVEDVFSIVLDHIAIFDVFNLFLPFLSPANLKGLSVNLKI